MALCVVGLHLITVAKPASAAPQPLEWCGPGSATDLPDTVGGAQIHVVYARPADAADNFGRWVIPIARDLAAIDTWWQEQDPTRTLRFDFASFPGCDSAFGQLDISSVVLPHPSAHYEIEERDVIARVADDLQGSFPSPNKKYLVYFDGPVASGAVCGRGVSGPSPGASAIVYLQSQAACSRAGGGIGARGGAFSAVLAAHELIHTLDDGAQGGPHVCSGEGRHYCDDTNDILAPAASAASRLAAVVLDSGQDDYYGTGGPSDIRDSRFLARLDAPQFGLAVTVGAPGGRVTSDLPGVLCAAVCNLPWDAGSRVGLTAVPDPGYAFAGWDGACSGVVPYCALTLNADTAVAARFGQPGKLTLRVLGRGQIDRCATKCRRSIVAGEQITLYASPRAEERFLRWGGACRGRERQCTVTAVPGATVRAVFTS